MQNLIDRQYFWGRRKLANITEEEELNELDRYIAKYQKVYLEAMFGKDLSEDAPEELLELLYDTDTLESPIADMVYFYHNRDNATVTTQAGEKRLSISNTIVSSPNEKLVEAWNSMVDFNCDLHVKLHSGSIVIDGIDYDEDILAKISPTHDIYWKINKYNL